MGHSISNVTATPQHGHLHEPFIIRSHTPQARDALRAESALPESTFHSMLNLERRRAERSRKPFVLMLIDDASQENGSERAMLDQVMGVILLSKRETDLVGWYKEKSIVGILFTEVSLECELPIAEILRTKIRSAIAMQMGEGNAARIATSVHLFPENLRHEQSATPSPADSRTGLKDTTQRLAQKVKRIVDAIGTGASAGVTLSGSERGAE